jgi:hypothetical protein
MIKYYNSLSQKPVTNRLQAFILELYGKNNSIFSFIKENGSTDKQNIEKPYSKYRRGQKSWKIRTQE